MRYIILAPFMVMAVLDISTWSPHSGAKDLFCIHYPGEDGDCSYGSAERCHAAVRGPAVCILNPKLLASSSERAP
ncbi:DUF3551 domain-containing protein [Tardiphaga sp. 866_E4_N2_1]|uniref:DUF3551 domain-containing protein n=1 Tax=unclassified Tardiphaga TaxID=2631404 RepID=UPI003F259D3C